jgi:pyridoxal phosphate enzyme (YggS family)
MLVRGPHRRLTLQDQEPHHQLRHNQNGRQKPHDHEKRFHQLALFFKIDQPGKQESVLALILEVPCFSSDSGNCFGGKQAHEGRFMNVERILYNLDAVERRITDAARRVGRPRDSVRLIAVTKKSPPEWIKALLNCSVRDCGENYPQELWRKHDELGNLTGSIHWHLIGHLQTNKVKKTLPMVRVIHSVDSLKLLRALNDAAPALDNPPSVCLQVNTSLEPSKHGWTTEVILRDAAAIATCRAIPIVGLMTIAALGTTAETARGSFVRLRELRDLLRRETDLPLVELSMGMSNDFETAIEEGATLVRVGSALFEGVDT